MSTFNQKAGRFMLKYFVIHPFLFLVGIIDFIIGLIVPYKYRDSELPDKDSVLTAITDKNDPKSPYRSVMTDDLIRVEDPNTNLYKEFAKAVEEHADRKTMGIREIISIDDEVQPNGKVFKKYSLGQYKWQTYETVKERIDNFSNGLLKLGLKSNKNVVLFAETRPEWIMSALACFRIKSTVVTLYSTLGVEALAYGINQTDASFVFTSGEQLPKIQKILNKIPNVTHLIVFNDKFTEKSIDSFKEKSKNLKVITGLEVEAMGMEQPVVTDFDEPKKDDLAIIMYTSGSTGNPKGVMISHGNLLTSIFGLRTRFGSMYLNKDIYVAYLPLAHVLELACELTCFLYGMSVGYSTPQTIADNSTAIKKGEKGDLRVLKPTVMPAVPIVLERLSKAVYEKLSGTSWFKQALFRLAYSQKLSCFRKKQSTRLLDRILFKRISSAVLGGKCRLVLCGGAILSREVQEFVQVCLSPVLQAYGLTETCASATSLLPNQTDTETVGSVVPCCEIRLVDWPEAGYRCTDTPYPRGEILIGGDCVTMGYYNMPEKTSEDYSFINGIRYFATGDIGEFLPNGNLKIIDRKKDLVKLSGGEYVSLNKVESVIKLLPLVDNICVVANPIKSNCVCLVTPNVKKLLDDIKEDGSVGEEQLESLKNINELVNFMDKSPKLMEKLTKEMSDHCLKQGLDRFEVPTKIKFVKETWLPDTGLVTDSLKLKRKEIDKFYQAEIQQLYSK